VQLFGKDYTVLCCTTMHDLKRGMFTTHCFCQERQRSNRHLENFSNSRCTVLQKLEEAPRVKEGRKNAVPALRRPERRIVCL
jgi:hypothetical protein